MDEYKYCPEHQKIKTSVSFLKALLFAILAILVIKIGMDITGAIELQKTKYGFVKVGQFQSYKDKDLEFKQKVYERLSRIEAILEEQNNANTRK